MAWTHLAAIDLPVTEVVKDFLDRYSKLDRAPRIPCIFIDLSSDVENNHRFQGSV